MYLAELREFRAYLLENTDIDELRTLNLLGVLGRGIMGPRTDGTC